ncbi:hypothetical protein D3C87_1089230 [compost metagenome]
MERSDGNRGHERRPALTWAIDGPSAEPDHREAGTDALAGVAMTGACGTSFGPAESTITALGVAMLGSACLAGTAYRGWCR